MNVFQLTRTYRFEAAHRNTDGDVRTSRLHGHNYLATVVLEDAADPSIGWFLDYGDIDASVAPVLGLLDHHYLNDAMGTANARTTDVADWLSERLAPSLSSLRQIRVAIEGDCAFRPVSLPANADSGLPNRRGFGFETAHRLPKVHSGHRCGVIHGHSFRMEVAVEGLDSIAPTLGELYDALDHRYLNDIPGLDNPTSENIAAWAWEWLGERGMEPTAIHILETPTAGCLYRGPATDRLD